MVVAHNEGKKDLDEESVKKIFEEALENFKKTPDDVKRKTAYHEAGHCTLYMCSEHFKKLNVVAVSIIPANDYGGITIPEKNEDYFSMDATFNATFTYYIDEIAVDLAGRVAETINNGEPNPGAVSDLLDATEMAYQVISLFGMSKYGANRVLLEELTSEDVKNKTNMEIDRIIELAMKRAEEVIRENITAFNTLVDRLVEKGIVGSKEIQEIFGHN